MIKSMFFACIVCMFISCNNNSTPSSANVDSTTSTDHTAVDNTNPNPDQTDTVIKSKTDVAKNVFPDLIDWEIGDSTFNRMTNAKCPFSTPDSCNLQNHKKFRKALRLIEAHYPILDWNYSYVAARFEDVDVTRYKKTRKRRNPDNEKVRGRATLLLIVSPKDMSLTDTKHFFDICIICPPPNTGTCDLDDPVFANSKK